MSRERDLPPVKDKLGRFLQDLRISVTDRCNFRCTYCMPKEVFGPDFQFLPRTALLTYEEITRLARLFVQNGVRKLRITGGEPLLRSGLEDLIASLRGIPGVEDIALTTNGSLLTPEKAKRLKEAGLNRVTVSLDSLNDEVFMAMNDMGFPVSKVLAAIDAADSAGLAPVKINTVVKRGINEEDVVLLAERFRGTGHIVRFIEYMDVGNSNGWRLEDVVPAAEILRRIGERWPIRAVPPTHPGEVATRYVYEDGGGEIGIIASVTRPFCGACTRARLSSDGKLFTCLFASSGVDFRQMLRSNTTDEGILAAISNLWGHREDRYSELRTLATTSKPRIEMSQIGG